MSFDVDQVHAELTLDEKAALTSGSDFWWTYPVERLGVPAIMVADGPHGLRVQPGRGDHAGIGGSLPATCFPTASAIASTWNPALIRSIGEALAQEARASRLSVILGPGINLKRSPLCGRNFEYFSEDPYLTGELAVAMVDGIQSRGVGTSIKHFAANNQEHDRLRVDAQVDERTLREIYLAAFERVVTTAAPWTVMCAYNKVNGLSASENPWLLTSVLRDEWGFDGLVVSDWGAVYHRVPALEAGLDLEMPPKLGRSPREVAAAVRAGQVPKGLLDQRVRNVLELVRKGTPTLDIDEDFDVAGHHALARRAAAESVVLLQNTNRLLPLRPETSVALIGEFARTPRYQGAGSSEVNPIRIENLIDELTALHGDVQFAAGFDIDEESDDDALLNEAVATAQAADTVVMVIGLPGSYETEGLDRSHMRLPANQLAALAAIADVNPNLVVVLVNGATVELDPVLEHSAALVEAWLGGQAAAGGIADVLTGQVNPSGRLAETFPHRLEDNSSYLNFPGDSHVVRYGEGLYVGYRGYDKCNQDVTFPFGFGLSYTTFEVDDLVIELTGRVGDGSLAAAVSVSVANTGGVAGAHVVQVYVRDPESSVHRPVRELKGFTRVELQPGESRRIQIDLDQRAFSFWSEVHNQWVVEEGEFVIEVGHHSRDLPLATTVFVTAPSLRLPLTADSTLAEWIADPIGRELLIEAADAPPETLQDPDLVRVAGTMPMATIAAFGGGAPDHETLGRLVAVWQERSAAEKDDPLDMGTC
ncbi:MAG: glycoside hydrolase family 3 C-terminal domain-containing protein [Acidimicrobiia bacterium]|nr:glycoside hydrolase family 3 C-terminal domain-containing protein [Acidimicrobiia bacterium]